QHTAKPHAVLHAAGVFVEDFAHRRAEGQFPNTRVLHASAYAVQLRAALAGEARLLEPVHPLRDDVRDVADGLDVVDDRRLAPEAGDRGERRLRPRIPALPFERVQQRGLLAADVPPGADVQVQVEAVTGTEDVSSEVAGLVRLRDRALEAIRRGRVCPAEEDV